MTLGKETRLVAPDDTLEETGRNLDRKRKGIIREGFQASSRWTDVEEEGLHRCTRLRTTGRLSHEGSVFSRPCRSPSSNLISVGSTMDSKTIELVIEKAIEYVAVHPLPTDVAAVPLDQKLVAERIDHTLLKPDATPAQITVLCEEAKKYNFKVNTGFVVHWIDYSC